MRPIDAALETLAEIADNGGAIPSSWLEVVATHELNPEWSIARQDLAVIINILRKLAPCKFLEIGAGLSTPVLYSYNPNGLNISLEDSHDWIIKVRESLPGGNGIILSYDNVSVENKHRQRTNWKAKIKKLAGYSEKELRVPYYMLQKRVLIPDWLWTIQFDVILIDGPLGEGPGRSGTSLLAAKLAHPTSVIFADDSVNRPYEMDKIIAFFPDRYIHSLAGGKLSILV